MSSTVVACGEKRQEVRELAAEQLEDAPKKLTGESTPTSDSEEVSRDPESKDSGAAPDSQPDGKRSENNNPAVRGILQIVSPDNSNIIVSDRKIEIVGRARMDAVVSVGSTFVVLDENGTFRYEVQLVSGPNVVEIVASIPSGEADGAVLAIICDC